MLEQNTIKYSDEWENKYTQIFDSPTKQVIPKLIREYSPEYNFIEIKDKIIIVLSQVN